MSLGAGMYEYLSDVMSVGERIFPLTLPVEAEMPAITWQQVSEDPLLTHDDAQNHPLNTERRNEIWRIQFSLWAHTYDETEALLAELKTAIKGFRGTWGSVPIEAVIPLVSLDDYEPGTGLYRKIADYSVEWKYEGGS